VKDLLYGDNVGQDLILSIRIKSIKCTWRKLLHFVERL